jgi:VIT1/CCC1 family predicted Fe2+/Mn2+ transporter
MTSPSLPVPPKLGHSLNRALYVRNFVFGSEDSLVSTVGLLSGVASAGMAKQDVIVTGVILLFVEAISMAVGSYLSENSAEEYMEQADVPMRNALVAGSIMFGSYIFFGFIPLAPYLWLDAPAAVVTSIIGSFIALAYLGYISSRESNIPAAPRIKRMVILGGAAIFIGVVIGRFLPRG